MQIDIYTKVKQAEYLALVQRCEALEKENKELKADLQKLSAKVSEKKSETKTKKEVNE